MNSHEGPRFTRRAFLKHAGILGAGLLIDQIIPRESTPRTPETLRFSSSELGLSIIHPNIAWYDLPEDQTLRILFSLPFQHVRIAFPLDVIFADKNNPNSSTADKLINLGNKYNKTLHLQFGAKVFKYPEVHLPEWLFTKYPSLKEPNVPIDREEGVREFLLTSLATIAERYLPYTKPGSIHVENEAFSMGLAVSKGRYIRPSFNQQEIAVVRKYAPTTPFVQNLPWDTPRLIPDVFNNADIVGVNIYNQTGQRLIPSPLDWIVSQNDGMWTILQGAEKAIRTLRKRLIVPEYQTAAWITDDRSPVYPFSQQTFQYDIGRIKQLLSPEIIFLWDVEQRIFRAKQTGDKSHINTLYKLVET